MFDFAATFFKICKKKKLKSFFLEFSSFSKYNFFLFSQMKKKKKILDGLSDWAAHMM